MWGNMGLPRGLHPCGVGDPFIPPLGFGTTKGMKSTDNLVAGTSQKLIDEDKYKVLG